MLRQHLVAYRKAWASGLVIASAAVGGLAISNLVFTTSSSAAENVTTTERVSIATNGSEGLRSDHPSTSADGRFIVFDSYASFDPDRDDPGDDGVPDQDIYVRDTVLKTTTYLSHSGPTPGEEFPSPGGAGNSTKPVISANGRYIAFQTTATNIPARGATPAPHVVVCDRGPAVNGAYGDHCTFTLVSANEGPGAVHPQISASGAVVTYEVPWEPSVITIRNASPNAGPAPSTPWLVAVSLTRNADGTVAVPTDTDRVQFSAEGTVSSDQGELGLKVVRDSALSANGNDVAFVAEYTTPPSQDNVLTTQTLVHYDIGADRRDRLDVDAKGQAINGLNHRYATPAWSGNGRRYAFADQSAEGSSTIQVVDRDPDGDGQLWSNGTGTEPLRKDIASLKNDASQGDGYNPAFSADGRYLAFVTPTAGMHNGVDDGVTDDRCDGGFQTPSGPGHCDVVLRDVIVDARRADTGLSRLPGELVTPDVRHTCKLALPTQICEGDGHSGLPVLSADGSSIAFTSIAANLVTTPVDNNNTGDVYVRRLVPGLVADAQDFGSVAIGTTAVRDVAVRQIGFGPIAVTGFTVTGADRDDFDVFPGETCTEVVLQTTDQCTVSIRFKPTVTGPRSAVIRVTGTRGNPIEFTVRGTGALPPAPGFAAAPAQLAFGERGIMKTSPSQTVTVRNTGNAPLHIHGVQITGTEPIAYPKDYQITADACGNKAIPAGGSCAVAVRHRPTAVGVRPGVLRIDYDGAPVPPTPTPSTSSSSAVPSTSASASAVPDPSAAPVGPPPGPPQLTFSVQLTGTGKPAKIEAGLKIIPVGDVTLLKGTNFPPDSEVRLGFDKMPVTQKVRTDAEGNFSTPFLIMSHNEVGKRTLRAEVAAGSLPDLAVAVVATADVTLDEGSLQPPDFLNRN